MKYIKRIVLIILGLIACFAISLFIFLQIRKYKAQSQLIHHQSTAILKVAIDDIFVDIVKNAIVNPGYYTSDTTQGTSARMGFDWGFYIPAEMYFFSVNQDDANLYSYQRVKDENKLIAFLLQKLKLDTSAVNRESDDWVISAYSGKVNIIGNGENMLLGISAKSEGSIEKINKIWQERATNMIQVSNLDADDRDSLSGDLAYLNLANRNRFNIDFQNGIMNTTASLHTELWKQNKVNKVRKLGVEDILSFYCNANLRPLIEQNKSLLTSNNIPVDSLVKYYGGYVDLQWKKGDIMQSDTIIAYDYNDDFEMVEKKEVRQEQVPNLIFTVKGSPHMASYLPEKMFYKFTKNVQNGYLTLRTSTITPPESTFEFSDYFMVLHYTYDESMLKYLGWIPNVDKIQEIIWKGTFKGESTSTFEGDIKMLNPKLHPIVQLMK